MAALAWPTGTGPSRSSQYDHKLFLSVAPSSVKRVYKSDRGKLSELSRRRVLTLAGGATSVAVAGCSSNDDPDDATDDPFDPEGDDDRTNGDGNGEGHSTFTTTGMASPDDVEWNPLSPTYSRWAHRLFLDRFAVFSPAEQSYRGVIATEWGFEEENVIYLELHDGYRWTDDEELTATDAATHFELKRLVEPDIDGLLASVEPVEDHRLHLTLRDGFVGVNEAVVWNRLFWWENWLTFPDAWFGEYAEALRDATDADEREAVREEAANPSWGVDDLLGHSLWVPEDVDDQRWLLTARETYPHAENVEYDRQLLVEERSTAALAEGRVTSYAGGASVEDAPERYDPAPAFAPTFHGFGPCFGPGVDGDGPFADPRVRKAIAHLIDFEEYRAAVTPEHAVSEPYQCGTFGPYRDEYLGGLLETFEDYEEADPETAAVLLEDAGYTGSNDGWRTPADEPFEPTLRVPEWLAAPAQELLTQLLEFGIAVDGDVEPTSEWIDRLRNSNEFDLTIYGVGATFSPHPYFDFHRNWTSETTGSIAAWGLDPEPEVPMPIGDPDGAPEAINVPALIEALRAAPMGSDEERELVEVLAWVHNQTLPRLQIANETEFAWIDTENWAWPDEDEPLWRVPDAVETLQKFGRVEQR